MEAATKANIAIARWIFEQEGKDFPDDPTYAAVDTEVAYGGYCETCSYSYTYLIARVWAGDKYYVAEYEPYSSIDLGAILAGVLGMEDEDE